MGTVYYDSIEEAEEDAERYDEYYEYLQLRTGVRSSLAYDGIHVVYNAPWPIEEGGENG